jgi:hypothetical protein
MNAINSRRVLYVRAAAAADKGACGVFFFCAQFFN